MMNNFRNAGVSWFTRAIFGASAGLCVFLLFSDKGNGQSSPCPDWNGIKFVSVPSGSFTMGANNLSDAEAAYSGEGYNKSKRVGGAFKDELPKHKLSVGSFCLMRDSLTRDQAKMLLTRYKLSEELGNQREDGDKYATLTWRGAQAIASAMSKEIGKKVRLPTEAEWEYAARGGVDGKPFPWGSVSETYNGMSVRDIVLASRRGCSARAIKPMIKSAALERCIADATKRDEGDWVRVREVQCFTKLLSGPPSDNPPNGYGLVNLVNNEWEWTSSRYMPYPYNPGDGREDQPKLKREARSVRGGNNNTETCLGYTSLRGYGYAGTDRDFQSAFGIRLALDN